MTRTSARLNNKPYQFSIDAEILRNMMNNVHKERCIKKKIIYAVDIIDYVINNFNEIKSFYMNTKPGSFTEFSRSVSYKIDELIVNSENYLHQGYKVKGSIKKLRYYQFVYDKIYTEYKENMMLANREKNLTIFINKKKELYDKNYQEMKKHIKKFLIDKLPLCYDVTEIIKSYCFYDKKTSETIKLVKELKIHIVSLFNCAMHSRKNGFDEDEYDYEHQDTDEVEHWGFRFNEYEIGFQAVNCQFCGNYCPEVSQAWVPPNILCYCYTD